MKPPRVKLCVAKGCACARSLKIYTRGKGFITLKSNAVKIVPQIKDRA